MKIAFVLFLLTFTPGMLASEIVKLGIATSLKSEILDEQRHYKVYLPPSYQSNNESYPVIYLLDGDIHRFKGFVGVLESLSTGTLGNQVQQAIVVAVPNTDRSRDLTPSVVNEWKFKDRVLDTFDKTGNARKFSEFLEKELIPDIEAGYRTSGKRVLVGESFGGLFAANVLLHSTSLFSHYLIIDPTALWDDNYLNRTYEASFKNSQFDSSVFFAFANNAHLGEIGVTNYTWGIRFATSVINNTGGKGGQQYFEHETHGTVALLAWYTGLKALLPASQE